ncbi:hypothetical protein [Sphingobium sp. RAC03]|uniref:hypothetical protein n=1 Tax=Sphingobium sp. RAC03 TaxID=1843368 RepID=UPI00083E6963|nr:hypothetical protein [Sphingobium sp. RAC03]AOF95609.1 hypothetical protein BSY17_2644 [Sphingobium sp. RAC03]
MSKRHDVDQAVLALVRAALPDHEVIGLEDGAERVRRTGQFETVTVRDGELDEEGVDLSPPTWHWQHRVPIELRAYKQTRPLRQILDGIAGKVGAAVAADRELGGMVSYLDVSGLEIEPLSSFATRTELGATFDIIATYSTSTPL